MIKLPIGLAAAALVAACVIYLLGVTATARWERYADKLREGGVPLTYEEIDRQRTTYADEENSAKLILELDPFVDRDKCDPEVFVFGWTNDGQDVFSGIARSRIEPSRALMVDYRELFDKLERIGAMPGGRFAWVSFEDPQHSIGAGILAPRYLSQLLHAKLLVQLVDGGIDAAANTCHLLGNVAASLDEVPDSIARLVQVQIQTTLASGIEQTLRAGMLAEPDLHRLSVMLNDRHGATTMKWALLGERAYFVHMLDTFAGGSPTAMSDYPTGASIFAPLAPDWVPVWQSRRGQMLGADLLTTLIEVGDDPVALLEAAEACDVQRDAAPRTAVFRCFLFCPTQVCESHQDDLALLRSAMLGVGAERFRVANGRFPTSLDELVPAYVEAVPVDPFNGEPMRLAVTEHGIVIYSVSWDLSDDGGDVARSEARRDPPDVGFRLVMPEHRGVVLIDMPAPSVD